MSQVSPRSGRRKKLRLENEAPSGGARAVSKSNTRRGEMLGQETSMIGSDFISPAPVRPSWHDASPSNGRREDRMQQYEPEEVTEDPEAEEGMDLDADIPDGDLDLDADVPDMDDIAESDEEEEEEIVSTTIDSSGVDVDMSTPTAPARSTRPAAAGGRSGTATAGQIRSQHSSITTTPSGPPPISSTARAAPPRRTRGTQAPQQPQQGPGRRIADSDGTDNGDNFRNPPPYPPPQISRMRQTPHAPPARPAPQHLRRNGSPPPGNGTNYDANSRFEPAPANPPPQPQYQHHPQQQQQHQHADTELHSRRRIQEETEAVRERERARRARILGGPQAQAQAAPRRLVSQGQQGMAPPPPPPNYGGAPGRTVRR
jgi:hypothetical protein